MSDKVTTDKQAAAQKQATAHFAAASVGSFFITFFVNVFLPILPALLLSAAPQIATNPKLQTVLKEADRVIDTLIGEA